MFIIIWKGWGLMVLLIVLGCFATIVCAANYFSGVHDFSSHHRWVTGSAFLFSAIPIYLVGHKINSPTGRVLVDRTGRKIAWRCQHTLFFIPFEYWAFIVGLCGIVVIVSTPHAQAVDLKTEVLGAFKAIENSATLSKSEASPADPPPPKAEWFPPLLLPSQADWTWITPDKIYHKVRIMKIEADQVLVSSTEGSVAIPTWTLPADIRKRLNYDPGAAIMASAARPQVAEIATPADTAPREMASQRLPMSGWETENYALGVAQAKALHRNVLLYFTGSDWCPTCQIMDREILATSDFRHFAQENFVMVTLDFPHQIELGSDQKAQNEALETQYGVTGYPTLIAVTPEGKELKRTIGCVTGNGAVEYYIQGFTVASQ